MSELCDFLNQEVPAFKAAEMQREEEARQAEAKRAGESRMRQLEAVVLYDRGAEYRKIADAAPELAYLNSEHARQDPQGRDMLLGQRVALDFHGGDVRGGLRRTIDGLPEEERRAWEARYGECKDERDGMRLLGELARTRTEGAWEAWQRREAERKADVEGVRDRLERELPGCVIEGRALPADLWGVMEKYSDETRADEVRESLERAQAAFAAIQWRSHGGSRRDYEGRVRAKADELREKWRDGVHWAWTDEPSEDEYLQQARAEVGSDVGVEVDREFLAGVAAMLRADGKMDERAAAMLAVALWQDARGEQTIDSKFCRNLVTEMERWGQSALDYMAGGLVKSAAKTGVLYTGPDTPPVYYTEAQRAALATEVARDFSPDVETLRSYVSKALDERLDASAQADMLSAAATKVGTITGDTAPILLAQTLAPGVGGFLAGSALMFPSTAGRMRADAYAEGLKHPELVGNVGAFFETAAEAGFGPLSKFPGVSRVIDKAALRLVGVPVLGRAIGAVQGNAALRYATGTVIGESAGELVGENVVSETGTYLTLNGLRAVGMDLDAPEWAPFLHSWQGMQDARQTGATVAYCALIGLGGVRGDMQRARAFAEDQRRLMTAGLSSEGAAKVASLAERQRGKAAKLLQENRAVLEEARDKAREKALEAGRKGKKAKGVLAEAREDKRIEAAADAAGAAAAERKALELTAPLDDELRELMQEVYRTDVLYADPLKVRERMRREHELYMSDVEAQTALREGILKAALREAGVLDVKLGADGRNLVHLKARGEDGAEGEERVVEWTDEQLAAFSQYAIGNENLRRMKAIRSAALAIDMAGKIDGRGYAETLPLTAEVAPVAAELAKAKGKMTLDVLDALGKAALHAEKRGVDLLPGVSNSVVGNAAASLVERARWDSGAGWRGVMSGRAGAMAMRMPMRGRAASKLVYLRGQTKSVNMVEDAVESMLYRRLVEVGGVSPEGSTTAAGREWLEGMMADMRRVNAEVKRMTGRELASGLEDAEATLMNVVEYFSHLAQSSFYQRAGSAGLGEAARRHVEFMDAALVSAKLLGDMGAGFNAWAATEAGRKWAAQGGTLATLLQEAGHEMGSLYEMSALTAENVAAVEAARREARVANRARIDAQDVQARMQAVGLAEAEAKAPGGCGGASASRVVQEAESEEEAIRAAEEAAPVTRKEKHEDALRHDEAVLTMHSGEEGAEVPDAVRSVFVDGHCVHNSSGGYYCGIVDTAKVRGVSAKEGNVGGKDGEGASAAAGLAENVAPADGPLHLLVRKDGSLEPIGGGERLAMLKGAPTVQQHLCYVYVEGDEFAGVRFDEGWARMLGYELSMREGTADEVTAGRYARETGYSEEYMTRKGLMCEATRSKRGINIGRQAGEELWKRFADGEVSAKDADTICRLTAPLAARARVADIQAACCRMLSAGKSWAYIGAMVQLQALGVDADADMDRMAQFVERNIHVLDEAIGALKGARTRQNAPDQAERLADLERIRSEFELVGSQPEMLAQARRWDGETEPDPVGEYQERAARKRERERRESGLDAEGYLKAKDTQISASVQDDMQAAAGSIQNISRPDKDGNIRNHGMQRPAGLDEAVTKYEHAREAQDAKKAEEARNALKDMLAPGVDAALKEASKMIPHLERVIDKTCAAVPGCSKMMRKGTKKAARIIEKAINDYQGDASRVIDMIGGTIIIPNGGSYVAVIDAIKEAAGEENIVKLKRFNFNSAKPSYHDIKVSVRFPSGIIGEIIVVSEFINDAKFNRGGHLVYEVRRELEPYADNYKEVFEAIHSLNELSAAIYDAEATAEDLERSKAKAASSLQCLRSLLPKMDISEGVKGVSNSPDALLNRIKPASVSSTAALISLQTQNISKDDVPQDGGDVNKKNPKISESEQRGGVGTMSLEGGDDGGELWRVDGESEENYNERLGIMEYAKAHGTWLLAPNGEPSNLTPQQWTFVRSRAFMKWFGHWNVMGTEAKVVEVSLRNDIRTTDDAKKYAAAHGIIGEMTNAETGGKGVITISGKSIGEMTNKNLWEKTERLGGSRRLHYAVIPHLREIIREAVFAETHPQIKKVNGKRDIKNGTNPNIDVEMLYGAISFKGKVYRVQITCRRHVKAIEQAKAYAYNVEKIELVKEPLTGAAPNRSRLETSSISADILLHGVRNVNGNLTLDDFSKVLDENGEPLVVYHGTPKGGFTEFKEESYFTPHREYAERYVHAGGKGNIWGVTDGEPSMYELFLNIRKPFDTRTKADAAIFEREFLGKWGNNTPLSERGLPDWTDAADLLEFLAERGGGYDGVIIDEGGDPDANGNPVWRGVSYLTASPTQIKSATENRGTFDGRDADITHSLAQDDDALDGVGGMEMASAHALAVLEARADEAYAAQLAREFRRKAEAWSLARVRGDEKEGRLGRGAKLFGELMALVDAAELTLGAAANTGRLHFLLAWARVYAGMMEDGSAPMGGELKGEIYDAFVERMREREADARRHGLTDEEVQEMMAEYAGERLDIAMDRVLRHVLGSLDGFLKARARERMDYLREKAYPKRPEGKPWPRGKMSAENYRRVEEIYRYLEMDAERVADLIEGKKQALEKLRDEGVGDDAAKAREEELEDELALLAMYGCWESKSAEEAQAAAASFADFVLNGRRAWQEKLRQERRRLAWQRKEIARHFKGARDELLEKGAQRNAKESASDMNIGKSSMRGYMNMSHLLKSLEGRMGSRWTSAMRQRLADIHEGLQVFLGNLEGWLLEDVRACTGLTKEADMEDWMRSIHEVYDTGIILRVPLPGQTVQLTPEEARMWLSLTAQEREAKRKEMLAAAEAAEEAPDNIPTDEQIEELRRKVAGSWLAGAASGRERMSGAWSAARQEKLRAAREAKEAELGRELTREEVSQLTEEHGRLTKEELKAAREAMVDALAAELPEGAVTENENAPAYFFLKGSEMTEQRLVTTKATLLQAVLTFDQPDYEHLMEANGVDDAVLAEMRRQIGPALLELGYRMRERLNENGVRMAKVYENLTGVPFGFRANYFKGCFDTGKPSTQGEAVEREGSSTTASGKHGMLIPRRFHTLLIPWQTNVSAVSVYLQAMKEQNRYELTADFVHELRALFADRVFAMECRAEIGDTNMDLLLGWTRLVEGSLVASEKQQNFINKLIGKFISAMAVVRLAFNVNTYVKQCTAVNNAYLGGYVPAELGYKDDGVQVLAERHLGLAEWHAAMGRVMSGRGVVGLRELAKSDMFAYRDRKDGAHLAQAALLGPNRKVGGRVGKASRAVYEAGMAPIGKLDVGSNVVGAAILYDATWHHLEAEDRDGRLSDAERHELCRMTVRKMLDFAAQPVLRTQKSYHAAAGTFGSFGSNMFLFRSESVKNFGGWMAQVLNGETGAAVAGNAFFGVANALLVGMLSWLAGFWPDEDDEDRWAKVGTKFTLDALTGDLASVPVLDDIVMGVRHLVEQQVENATDVKVKSPRFQDKGALFDLLDAAQREYRNMEEGNPWQRHVSAVTRLLGAVGACTAFCKNSAVGPLSDVASLAWAAAACGNMAKFMRNVYDRVDEEDA